MELKDYSDEQLKDELVRRSNERRKEYLASLDELTEKEYRDGYESGYTWLNRDVHPANFRHPSEPLGYIPGGPLFMTRRNRGDKGYEDEKSLNNHRAIRWHQGWKDGINAYVAENRLGFPQVR